MLDSANAAPSTTDWARQRELFEAVLELPGNARHSFVQAQTAGEPELAQSLVELLAAHARFAGNTEEQRQSLLELASQLTEQADLGTQVGPYTLVSEIGRGGMGVVWLARRNDGTLAQTVAIKLLPPHRWDASSRARFNAERQIIASLEHPGIARLLDAGEIQGQPYFVMEYVEGKSITDYAAAKNLTQRERIALFQQVLDAVDYAHRQLVIHRDLKPSNILVTGTGVVKLIDFGIAKTLSIDANDTGTNQRFFSPSHAAPEQLSGKNIGVGVDIYQLGTVLYELLSGMPAFDFTDSSAAQIEAAIRSQPPKAPSKHKASISAELDAIALHCLKKAAIERYLSVHALAEDLRRVLTHRVISIRQGQGAYRVRKFLRRNWVATTVGLVFLALVLSFFQLLIIKNKQITNERDVATAANSASESVNNFLVGVFGGDAEIAQWDSETKVVDFFLASVKTIKNNVTIPQSAKSALSLAVAQSLLSLGKSDEAKALVGETKASCLENCGARNLAKIDLLDAQFLYDSGDRETAMEKVANALNRLKIFGPQDELALEVQGYRFGIADQLSADKRASFGEADILSTWQKLRPLFPASNKARHKFDADFLDSLTRKNTDLDKKAKIIQDILAEYAQFSGVEPGVLAGIHRALANNLYNQEKYQDAENSYETSLELTKKSVGSDNLVVARIYLSINNCQRGLELLNDARVSMLAAQRIAFLNPAWGPAQAAISYSFGGLELQAKNPKAAAIQFATAQKISSSTFGELHPQTRQFQAFEAVAHAEAGETQKAISILQALRASRVKIEDAATSRDTWLTDFTLSSLLLTLDAKQAERLFRGLAVAAKPELYDFQIAQLAILEKAFPKIK